MLHIIFYPTGLGSVVMVLFVPRYKLFLCFACKRGQAHGQAWPAIGADRGPARPQQVANASESDEEKVEDGTEIARCTSSRIFFGMCLYICVGFF